MKVANRIFSSFNVLIIVRLCCLVPSITSQKPHSESTMCQKFYRVHEAMDAALLDKNVSVFSKEICSDGKRFFLLCTKDYFWSFYQNLPNGQKKYFEVIGPGKLI